MSCKEPPPSFYESSKKEIPTPDHWKHSVEYGPQNAYPGRMKEMIDRSSPGRIAIPDLDVWDQLINKHFEEDLVMKAGKKMHQFRHLPLLDLTKNKPEPTIKLNKKPMKIEKLQKGNQLQKDIEVVNKLIKGVECEKGSISYPSCEAPSKDVGDDLFKIVESNRSALLKKLNAKLAELETEFEKL